MRLFAFSESVTGERYLPRRAVHQSCDGQEALHFLGSQIAFGIRARGEAFDGSGRGDKATKASTASLKRALPCALPLPIDHNPFQGLLVAVVAQLRAFETVTYGILERGMSLRYLNRCEAIPVLRHYLRHPA